MTERPIIFSGPMVRAILDGRKTQTRRVVRPQPVGVSAPFHPESRGRTWVWMARDDAPGYSYATGDFRCPYGAPGDRLWVRETWAVLGAVPRSDDPVRPGMQIEYRADEGRSHTWRPSIHMPRAASRLTLEVVSVRVESLQEISGDDALAEGADGPHPASWHPDAGEIGPESYRDGFRELWDSINGKRAPWESNPWVWAITFRRVE